MKTEIIKLYADNIDMDKLRYAAQVIRDGGLVAFPTETVYGLGANALNEEAVRKTFEVKGRPPDNPLIAHIACKDDIKIVSKVALEGYVKKLTDEFWPGPLTLIMEKTDRVPYITTAGLDTVAVRMPSHPVAMALIKESGVPISAPSANSSGKPSPTRAEHVIKDLSGKIDVIIDSGETTVGLESTVLDITTWPPVILRPGGITPSQLSRVLGTVEIDPAITAKGSGNTNYTPKSPGLKYKHYSPEAEVIVIEGRPSAVAGEIIRMAKHYIEKGLKVGIMATEQTKNFYYDDDIICQNTEIILLGDREKPETIAANLFRALREFDNRRVKVVLAEAVESTGIGLAIMNRLNKAAGYNIINVGW
ncbi:MAG TPA: threonylcarbamoyl-AMP synthase [Clostridiaceae bacterium]|nr:threonylcarbamoyl-AMP synthase [Clostridiaceae bacterium]